MSLAGSSDDVFVAMQQPGDDDSNTLARPNMHQQGHQGYNNALDAAIWLWPIVRVSPNVHTFRGVERSHLVSFAVACFLASGWSWLTLSQAAKRFHWLRNQYCGQCRAEVYGSLRTFAWVLLRLEAAYSYHELCYSCQEAFNSPPEDFGYRYVCTHCGEHHDCPETHKTECIYNSWSD